MKTEHRHNQKLRGEIDQELMGLDLPKRPELNSNQLDTAFWLGVKRGMSSLLQHGPDSQKTVALLGLAECELIKLRKD